jgi:hypothetical protein
MNMGQTNSNHEFPPKMEQTEFWLYFKENPRFGEEVPSSSSVTCVPGGYYTGEGGGESLV